MEKEGCELFFVAEYSHKTVSYTHLKSETAMTEG